MNSGQAMQSGTSIWDWSPTPYQGRNIRQSAYLASAVLIPGAFMLAWALIALDVIEPMPADKYVSVSLFIGYWSLVGAICFCRQPR